MPSPPSNLSVSQYVPHVISWNAPKNTGLADANLKYRVSIESMIKSGTKTHLYVEDTYSLLKQAQLKKHMIMASTSTITVCVSAVNCAGTSNETCINVTASTG